MLYLSCKDSLYHKYRIKKPNGKFRKITAPNEWLKSKQKELSSLLLDKYKHLISEYSYGFKKGVSIIDAVTPHVKKEWVLTVDVKDFFPSIRKEHLWFLDQVEKELATLDGCLVQGAPSSPVISNIVMFHHDEFFYTLFKQLNISYTRYADDLIFSGNFWIDKKVLIDFVMSQLSHDNFVVNPKKVKFLTKNMKQEVLGIIVNDGISISRKTRKNLRAAIHQENITDREIGLLSYIRMVNPSQYKSLTRED